MKIIPKVSGEWTKVLSEFWLFTVETGIDQALIPPTSVLKQNVKRLSDISYEIDVAFLYGEEEADLDKLTIYSEIDTFNLVDLSFKGRSQSLAKLTG